MTDIRTAELVLAAAMQCGALQTALLLHEIAGLPERDAFGGADLCQLAETPEHDRLRAAIEVACGRVSARVLGKHLAAIRGRWFGFHSVKCIGKDDAGLIWQCVSRAKLREGADDPAARVSTGFSNSSTSLEQVDE